MLVNISTCRGMEELKDFIAVERLKVGRQAVCSGNK